MGLRRFERSKKKQFKRGTLDADLARLRAEGKMPEPTICPPTAPDDARHRRSKWEWLVDRMLTDLGFDIRRQYPTKRPVLGHIRFFDFYIPELNLLIEADGEMYHISEQAVAIDKAKTEYADLYSIPLVRISTKYSSIPQIREWLKDGNIQALLDHTKTILDKRYNNDEAN